MKISPLQICNGLACALAWLASTPLSFAADDETGSGWGFWIEAGPVVRGDMKFSVAGSSYTQILGLHDPSAAGALALPSGIGSVDSYADRTYDNGYVKLDPGTGNPSAPNPSLTWNWGFNNPAQYNASARTLAFQKTGPPGYSVVEDTSPGGEKFKAPGVQLLTGVPIKQTESWAVDVCLGFQGVWSMDEKFNTSSYREEIRRMTVTDVYDVSGVPAASFPAGGFHGTFLGPFDTPPVIPSPQIPNKPQTRSALASSALSTSYNNIGFSVDQSLYQLSLGPRITLAQAAGMKLHIRPNVSGNLVDLEVQRTEQFVQAPAQGNQTTLNQWSDHNSHSSFVLGLGVVAGLDVDLGAGFFLGGFAGYDWLSEKASVSVGPNTLRADASGWLVGGVIGKQF